ncbi:MAG: NAD+ synthase [Planctomycetota bacterium]
MRPRRGPERPFVRIALAQIDTTAGDVRGNVDRVLAAARRASEEGADLLVAPELVVAGYPPRDLLLRPGFVTAVEGATAALARELPAGLAAVVGTVARDTRPYGPPLVNAAAFLADGTVRALYAKRLLPTYDVFDERRYFAPGDGPMVVSWRGRRIGLLVCEDLWGRDLVQGRRLYEEDPPADTVAAGADVLIAISASPYHGGKDAHRRALFAEEARRSKRVLVTVQQVGGNDDVLFDGRSRVFDGTGQTRLRLSAFGEDFAVVDVDALPEVVAEPDPLGPHEELRQALVMGLRDYSAKTELGRVVLGLSGGVDSAVTAALAVDALGPENVLAVGMPGPFTAEMSRTDAKDLADALGVRFVEIPIQGVYEAYLEALGPVFEGRPFDVAEENIQARIRGALLMAISNKHGHLVLTTGNKSEVAVGYCTLYGDMNGGLALLSDVWKTRVYDLARIYVERGVMPLRIVQRPPSAELRADQMDSDSLPPYEVLDRILDKRIEQGWSAARLVAAGEDPALVERVLKMVERNEYKRRQMAPGLKVTPVAFGVGWRMPIAAPTDLRNET